MIKIKNINIDKSKIYPLLLLIITLTIFIKTTAPDVTTGDSGELLSSAYCLGIGHPPGYPLYLILAKLFSYIAYIFYPLLLLSGRNIFHLKDYFAFNVNYMSGFFAALSSLILYKIFIYLIENFYKEKDNIIYKFKEEISFLSALTFPFMNLIWSQSTNSEVYTLNLFILTLNFFFLINYYFSKNEKFFYLFSFFYGLNIVAHQTSLIFAPIFALWIYISKKEILKEYKIIIFSFLLFVGGLLTYIYLPIRSSTHPFIDWGNTSNLKNFLYHILRKQYGALVRKPQSSTILQAHRSVGMFIKQNIELLKIILKNLSIITIFLPFGFYYIYKKERNIFYFLTSSFVFYSLIMLYIANFKIAKLSIYVNEIFFIPSLLILMFISFFGIIYTIEKKDIILKYLPFIPILFILFNYHTNNEEKNFIVSEYTTNIFKTVEKNGFLFVMGDNTTFPISYYYYVKNIRRDIFIIDEFGFIFQDMFRLTNLKPPLPPAVHKKVRDKIENALLHSKRDNLYFTYAEKNEKIPEGKKLIPYGLIYKVVTSKSNKVLPFYALFSYNFNSIDNKKVYKDLMDRDLSSIIYLNLGEYLNKIGKTILASKYSVKSEFISKSEYTKKRIHYNIALDYKKRGKIKKAIKELFKALSIDPDYAKAHALLGSIYSEMGYTQKAIKEYSTEVEIEPDNAKAWNNLGVEYNKIGNIKKAFECFKKSIEIDPYNYEAYNNLAVTLEHFHKYNEAIKSYLKAIQLNPKYKDAYYNLGTLLLNKNNLEEAYKLLKKAIDIYPKYSAAYYNIGILYQKKKDYKNAIPYFEQAIKFNKNFDAAYFNIGVCYLWLKKYRKAEKYFKISIKLNPESYIAYKHLGNTYYFLNDLNSAYKAWKKAYELDPSDKELENNIRVLESQQKK